jgi:hypothetical protein
LIHLIEIGEVRFDAELLTGLFQILLKDITERDAFAVRNGFNAIQMMAAHATTADKADAVGFF